MTTTPGLAMASDASDVQAILVPAGQEYGAVRAALRSIGGGPPAIAIPAGPTALRRFLADPQVQDQLASRRILLMGLAGSLSVAHAVTDSLWLEATQKTFGGDNAVYACDPSLTQALCRRLPQPRLGTGITTDHIVTTVAGKQRLHHQYQADIVDMESAVLLEQLPTAAIAVVRVISDDCHHALPDISQAIRPDGTLNAGMLARAFLRRPVAAARFIGGSLAALAALRRLTRQLFEAEQQTVV